MSVAVIGPVGASQMKLNPITDNIMNRIHQKMSLEQKIQTLKEDFLDREQTTFVKIRRTGRLGWDFLNLQLYFVHKIVAFGHA